MRKVTKQAIEAFYNRRNFKRGNTKVYHDEKTGITGLYLFSSWIAKIENYILSVTLAGWNTSTTRERLNGLKGVSVTTKKGQVYLNGNKWDGDWTEISE